MTKADIIKLARDAGFNWPEVHTTTIEERLERFANLVAAHKAEVALAESYLCGYEAGVVAERERAEERVTELFADMETPYLPDIIAAITRARGTT